MRTLLAVALMYLATLATGTASAVELRDAALVAAGSPALQNGTGTVRLEDSRLIFVPEPSALWQLGSGIGLLAFLAGRRGRTLRHTDAGAPGRSELATPKRNLP